VPFRIDIVAPATITVLPDGQSSLESLPPGGISVTDPTNGTIAVTITAGNAGAEFSASSASGASISTDGSIITIIGLQAQVNAALASLTIADPASDTVTITAIDMAELLTSTEIAVSAAAAGLGFTAPASATLSPDSLTSISGLALADPQAAALTAAGLGTSETIAITLSVASGFLFLPGLPALGDIQAAGNGTNQILLIFSADQLAAVNALLANLAYAGPAGNSDLAYAMRNLSGPLGGGSASGTIGLDIAGTQGAASTITAGADTVFLGAATLTGLTVSGITGDLGGLQVAGGAKIGPGAALELPYDTLGLGGTSYDFGTLGAERLNESGTLLIAGAAVIGGVLSLGPGGFIDLAGTLITANAATIVNQPGLSLGAGAVVTGTGTLEAGNFSEAGVISGPGTILTGPGDALVIDAASISGTTLDVDPGGLLFLGPVDPLYGIFNPTPLTVASNVTLDFLGNAGAVPVTGDYADSFGQSGGAIVIESPDLFSGTILGFAPGDRLIFPELSGITLLSITSDSFVVAGTSIDGTATETVSYLIDATYQSGAQLYTATDAEGDAEVELRDAGNDVFINGVTAYADVIFANPGISQGIPGMDVLVRSWTTQSLTVTVSVGHGVLADGRLEGASLTITAASPTALNATLASLAYTANTGAMSDTLTIASATGLLAGLLEFTPISLSTAAGTVSGFGDAGQTAWFAGASLAPITQAADPGTILVTGTADFADPLLGTSRGVYALRVDSGGVAIFDDAADVNLGDVTIGDAAGAGQLDVLTSHFFVGDDVTIGGPGAGSGAIIAGDVTIAGTVVLGASAAASLDVSGTLGAAIISIGAAGTLAATGAGGFEQLTDAGTINLSGQANFVGGDLTETGALSLAGASQLVLQGGTLQSGTLYVGPDAFLNAMGPWAQPGGALLLAGTLLNEEPLTASGVIALAGGTLIAPALTLAGTLTGGGIVEAEGSLGVFDASGGITAAGPLVLGDDVTLAGGAGMTIGAASALDVVHALSGGDIDFAGAGSKLTINDLAAVTTAVTNMLDYDAIDLVGVAPSLVSFAAGSISAGSIGGFSLAVAGGQPALRIGADGSGGTLLTLGGDIPCFCAGTRLLTPTGYRPVEFFSPGDPVITIGGIARAVRWIGRRTLDFFTDPGAQPVFFSAGALGPGVPARPVRLSPLHAVFFDDVLVPALHLVNGATITQEPQPAATYYHLELDRHDVIIAEGMPAETYLDNGNRRALYFEQGKRGTACTPCAPLVTTGRRLAAIRRRLHGIALGAGFAPTDAFSLRGAAADSAILPRIWRRSGRQIARFWLPPNAGALRLAASAAAPADTDPESEDRRRLGVCLRDAGGAALGRGWLPRAPADAGIWMGASAELLLPPGMGALTLDLAAVVHSWRAPGAQAPRRGAH
jgi:hypothetical protein